MWTVDAVFLPGLQIDIIWIEFYQKCFFFLGPAGVSKAQTIVKEVIDNFQNIEFPDKKPSGQ